MIPKFGGNVARFSTLRWVSYVCSLLAVSSCIIHGAPAPGTDPSKAAAEQAEPEENLEAPTGNWGKVKGVDILNGRGVQALVVNGKAERVQIGYVKVEGQPFDLALRAKIKETSQNNWDVQVQARNMQPIARGDVLLATFYFRTEWAPQESGEGETEFNFELAREPYTKSATYPVRAAREWKKVHVPFQAGQDFAPGEGQAIFRLGYSPETLDIGGVTIENFGKKLVLADLPKDKLGYPGMQPDAPWRQPAAERIEKIRKARMVVVVKDKSGNPVPNAKIRARLDKHAFGFGTCLPATTVLDPTETKIHGITKELFNIVTLENDLKWQPLAGDWGTSFTVDRAKRAVLELTKRGYDVRGHVLVWPGWRNLPKSLKRMEKDPAALRSTTAKHIRDLVGEMKGTLAHWDVMNEPFDNHDLIDLLGKEAMVEWFKLAREGDPKPLLFINDYTILSGGGGDTPHRAHYEETIKYLIDRGAPVDGIGLQGHFGTSLTGPEDMIEILDRYAKFNKTIWISEYDVVIDDEELAGKFTKDFYTTLFSHPAVGGIVMWGFWDGSHWKSNAPLYREDWSLKPAGEAYRELMLKTWRTDVSGQTNIKGEFETRGFLGSYVIEVSGAGKAKRASGNLKKGGTQLTVTLD